MERSFLDRVVDFVLGKIGEESKERGRFNLHSLILHEIGKAVRASEISREKTLQLIAESMLQVFPISKIVVYVFDRNDEKFKGRIGAGVMDKTLLDLDVGIAEIEHIFKEDDVALFSIKALPLPWKDLSTHFNTEKILFVALRETEKLSGFLIVEPIGNVDVLRNEEKRLYEYFAFIMAGVLHNAEMVSNLKRKTQRLEALSEIVRALNSTLEVDKLLELIVEKAIELTESTSGSIILIDKNTKELIIRAYKGLPSGTENLKLKIGEGITGKVAKSGKSRMVNDVEKDADYVIANPDVKSEMAVPLIKDGEVIGILNVDNIRKNAYEEEDLNLLEMLADSAVIAINNALLFDKCRRGGEGES